MKLLPLTFLSLLALAQDQIRYPTLISKTEPKYSDEARIARLEGTVLVQVVVNEKGEPTKFSVLRPLGLGLDESALENVGTWRFRPGMKAGEPVSVTTNIEVNYRLEPQNWHLTKAAFATSSGASRPKIVQAQYPGSSGSGEKATVSLSLDINEKGEPEKVEVVNSSDPKWDAEVAGSVKNGWRFAPAVKAGHAISAHATLDFARGDGARPDASPEAMRMSRVGRDASAPQVIQKFEPKYTEEARIARLEGKTVLYVVVDRNGEPKDLRALRPLALGLDRAAIDCVRTWKFQPGMKEGEPVAVQANVEVNFRLLLSPGTWRLRDVAFRTPSGASRPIIAKTHFPPNGTDNKTTISVSADIDEKGSATNVEVSDIGDAKAQRQIADAVAHGWRFEPGMKDGHPITVHAVFDFARGN